MFITTPHEITSLMPTARWKEPEKLFGYLEEEERVALEPLLGTPLFQHLCKEYERLRNKYVDITSVTVRPTRKARVEPAVPYADVTERMDAYQEGRHPYPSPCVPAVEDEDEVPETDMQSIRLLRICQQIEFYKMISHKAGLLAVSFNDGGGANRVSADGYDPAEDKDIDRMTKDAFMSAGRSIDSLLLFLEDDAKNDKQFTELWKEADAFYLHKDLLFQTDRVLNEYLPLNGGRMDYVNLVRDIRFCQNTYLKPRVGGKLIKALVAFLNDGLPENTEEPGGEQPEPADAEAMEELADLLRIALAFYVEARRVELGPKKEKLARRDSMTDAQQAMAAACQWIEDNLDKLGEAAVDTPIYSAWHARMEQEQRDRESVRSAFERRRREVCETSRKKLFTAFPHTHIKPEYK